MTTIELHINPRKAFLPYLKREKRFSCLVCHRRAGKTYSCLQDVLARALTHKRKSRNPLRYGYIAPTRDQAKDIAWNYLQKFTRAIPGTKVNQQELSLVLPNEAQIRLYSGDSYDRMRGLYFDGVVIDEPADIDGSAWPLVIRPCLSDYAGWATFIGTPKGKNAFYSRYTEACENPDEWFSMLLRASESGIIPDAELASLRSGMPEHAFKQEYECDFSVATPGAIYAWVIEKARQEGRIGKMPIADSPVYTSWDLGSPQNTSVWYWQIVGREIRVIDCDTGDLGVNTLQERVAHMQRKGYPYGLHFLPHDAGKKEYTGKTFADELASTGIGQVRVLPVTTDIWLGINALIGLFPTMVFRTPACEIGLDALGSYHTKEVDRGKIISSVPVHDWSSHTADALRYMAEALGSGMVKAPGITGRPESSRRRGSMQQGGFVG
jgi:phage terminase large subunit